MPNVLFVAAVAALLGQRPDSAARATLDTALNRMGGLSALRAIERLRVETITEWQRTALDHRPHPTVLSYEWSTELRDYTRPAWRYTRRFFDPKGWREIVDLVVDSVALIKNNGVWGPQNVAYVDERTETFAFSPDRVLVLASGDAEARHVSDTTLNGTRYARVRANIGRIPATLFFNRRDGSLALARFRAAQFKDFGLAPFGTMDVDIWYSRWQRVADAGVTIPTQLDIYRVGRPYKRVTMAGLQANPVIPADSFAIGDSLRAAFLAQNGRAMYDLPVDSAKIVDGTFAVFGTPGTPAGAVKLGGRWLLLEAGTAPVSVERSVAFLTRASADAPLGGTFVSALYGQGGLAWLVDRPMQTWVTEAARPYADAVLRGWGKNDRSRTLAGASWIKVGTDSARIEILDAPDHPTTAVLYVPSLRWAYAWSAYAPQVLDALSAHIRRRGWEVDRVGSARGIVGVALPPMAAVGAR